MKISLEIQYSSQPMRPTVAWLIAGGGPRDWLAEMTAWTIPLADVRLLVLPAGGVVVLLGKSATVTPQLLTAIPLGMVAGRLLLPVEAVLFPPLSDTEFKQILPDTDLMYVWRPHLGLVHFKWEQIFPITALLAAMPEGDRTWDAAHPGVGINTRLLSIAPNSPLSVADVMQAGRDDIGTIPLSDNALPPTPQEGSGLNRALRKAGMTALSQGAGVLGAAAQRLSQLGASFGLGATDAAASGTSKKGKAPPLSGGTKPAEGAGKNWLERLAEWANEKKNSLDHNLDKMRHNQIERLLHMLQNSPDKGLAFALPLQGTSEGRGLASPSAHLARRDINFNLRNLGGGGPIDFWDLPQSYRAALSQRYRELANRELALGRHRRAAYIFAELLGDLSTAATTLRDGGHFREAAVLYETKLNQPLVAAQCLQRGGLLAEALVIYQRLQAWQTIAELYEQLDQTENAREAWRKEIAKLLAGQDRLGAAAVLENKLLEPEEAYQLLRQGWPTTPQASHCLRESFLLLARLGEHHRAQQQIQDLQTASHTLELTIELAKCLAQQANKYPEERVRDLAADTTRRIVSESMQLASEPLLGQLVGTIAQLVPSDRLLARDTTRYRSILAKQQPQTKKLLAPTASPKLSVARTIQLPTGIWKTAASVGAEFYVVGAQEGKVVLLRGNWKGELQSPIGPLWNLTPQQEECDFLLAADPRRLEKLLLHVDGNTPQRDLNFPITNSFPEPLAVGPHPAGQRSTISMVYSDGGNTVVGNARSRSDIEGALDAATFDAAGVVLSLQELLFDDSDLDNLARKIDETGPKLVHFVRSGWSYAALGNVALVVGPKKGRLELPSRVCSICGSPPHTNPRIVFGCEAGGVILWGQDADSPTTIFAEELAWPVVGLVRGSFLVAVTAAAVQVYSTKGNKLQLTGEISGPRSAPVAILAHEQLNHFGLLTVDGRVVCYEVPTPK